MNLQKDENSPLVINAGHIEGPSLYALTVTSRKSYTTPEEFEKAFKKFLLSIKYSYKISLILEQHEASGNESKMHGHGILYCGVPPKNNKKNSFYFNIIKLQNLAGWMNYCNKNVPKTLKSLGLMEGHTEQGEDLVLKESGEISDYSIDSYGTDSDTDAE